MNRPFLPLSAVVGPTVVTCQLCGATAGGLQFFRGQSMPAASPQVLGLEACAACIQDAAGEFAMRAPLSDSPSDGGGQPPTSKRAPERKPARPTRSAPKGGRTR